MVWAKCCLLVDFEASINLGPSIATDSQPQDKSDPVGKQAKKEKGSGQLLRAFSCMLKASYMRAFPKSAQKRMKATVELFAWLRHSEGNLVGC